MHSAQAIWHAKIANVKIHATIRFVLQTPIARQPIIVRFVAVKKATVAIRSQNAEESSLAHTMLNVIQTFRAGKENASIRALRNAITAAIAES